MMVLNKLFLQRRRMKFLHNTILAMDYLYPDNYPAHPNPPAVAAVTNIGREFPLTLHQLAVANAEVGLKNSQRTPIQFNFRRVVEIALGVRCWNSSRKMGNIL